MKYKDNYVKKCEIDSIFKKESQSFAYVTPEPKKIRVLYFETKGNLHSARELKYLDIVHDMNVTPDCG